MYIYARVVGEPHDSNFRSVYYSAIFSFESQLIYSVLLFPETPTISLQCIYSQCRPSWNMASRILNRNSIVHFFKLKAERPLIFLFFLKTSFPIPNFFHSHKRLILAYFASKIHFMNTSSSYYFSRIQKRATAALACRNKVILKTADQASIFSCILLEPQSTLSKRKVEKNKLLRKMKKTWLKKPRHALRSDFFKLCGRGPHYYNIFFCKSQIRSVSNSKRKLELIFLLFYVIIYMVEKIIFYKRKKENERQLILIDRTS